jgi:hypothetical protein
MNPLTNADYYAPEPPTIRTEDPEPFRDGELGELVRSVERGYRHFCRARGITHNTFLFGRKTKQTT